jgi:hypothetical protein
MAFDPTVSRYLSETAFRAISYKKGKYIHEHTSRQPRKSCGSETSIANARFLFAWNAFLWLFFLFLLRPPNYFHNEKLFAIPNK